MASVRTTHPKRQGFKTARLVLRLLGMAPGLMVQASREYRQFKRCFLDEAVAAGLPRQAATDMVRQYKPMTVFRSLREVAGSKQEANS